MKKRSSRQEAIRDIVRAKEIRTQRVLVEELRAAGFDCTQATVSRDIADMGLRKLPEGVYVLAEDQHLQHMVSQLVVGVSRADNLVIIKAQPGTASGIAAAVDDAEVEFADDDGLVEHALGRNAEDAVDIGVDAYDVAMFCGGLPDVVALPEADNAVAEIKPVRGGAFYAAAANFEIAVDEFFIELVGVLAESGRFRLAFVREQGVPVGERSFPRLIEIFD